MSFKLPSFLLICVFCLLNGFTTAQGQKIYTDADYDRALEMMSWNTSKLIDHNIRPYWSADNRVWYRDLNATGMEFKLFDPSNKEQLTAASQNKLFEKAGINRPERVGSRNEILSPNGKYLAFIREWNLWMKNVETDEEMALTTDGIKDFGYATDNAGWRQSDRPVLSWSPDSKKIATYRQDQRHVSDMYLVKTKVGEPELKAWKYPIPGDSAIIQIHRIIIDLTEKAPKIVELQMEADPRRGTFCDDISCDGTFDDIAWSDNSKQLVFVSTSRDHKVAQVRIADTETGVVKNIFREEEETQYESGRGGINWRYFSDTNEIIWYSQRDNWGHLYLYDATTGELKNQITQGDFVVRDIVKIDRKKRSIYFVASHKDGKDNPYFSYLYKINFDGKKLKMLTQEIGHHRISLSPDGNYFIDSYSQADVPPVHQVKSLDGKLIRVLEKTDISRLEASGWKPAQPFTVKSANKAFDLYGLMYTPTKMKAGEKYPVIVYIYPGPQGGSVGSWDFRASRGDNQALAELGFVVVQLEGSCNPNRSKDFHDACYGDMGENTLADQIAGLKQLNERFNFMDLAHVGIWGHSGGGFATAAALFKYPDFFKVGISESGNHDNRNYEDDWGERYIGLETFDNDGVSNYELQANQTLAENLKGKLMIIHGGMDDNVPPYNSYLVADALIKANKDFDFILLPNARHGFGADRNYIMRRRWDYFIQHLKGGVPPKEYKVEVERDSRY